MSLFNMEKRGGAPAECYWFTNGTSQYGKYTSQDIARSAPISGAVNPIFPGGSIEEFTPLAIKRSVIDVGGSDQNLKVTLPASSAVGALYVGQRPIFTMQLSIYRVHRGDSGSKRVFYGDVIGASMDGGAVVLDCAPRSAAIKRPFLRVLYQAPCNHNLYDAYCGVDPNAFDTAGSIDSIAADGVTLSISEADALDDGWFTAGMLKFGSEYGFIRAHVGPLITLLRPVPGLAVSSSVTLFAGCDRSLDTCTTKFANTENHMGFPFIPTIDPFAKGVSD